MTTNDFKNQSVSPQCPHNFGTVRSVAETQTYFKLVHDPFTEEVVQCSPGEAVGQDCT